MLSRSKFRAVFLGLLTAILATETSAKIELRIREDKIECLGVEKEKGVCIWTRPDGKSNFLEKNYSCSVDVSDKGYSNLRGKWKCRFEVLHFN